MGCPTCSPGAGEASACDEINCLKRNVTIIVTTSPVPSNPSLELIDCTMHSFQHAPGLASCKKILVCDHYKISGGGSKSFRSGAMGHLLGRPGQLQNKMNTNTQFTGVISTAHEPKYREYKRLLADRITAAEPGSPYSNMTMLELSSHHGFGFAVQAAMERVATPLVMVVQVLAPATPTHIFPCSTSPGPSIAILVRQRPPNPRVPCSTTATSPAPSTPRPSLRSSAAVKTSTWSAC